MGDGCNRITSPSFAGTRTYTKPVAFCRHFFAGTIEIDRRAAESPSRGLSRKNAKTLGPTTAGRKPIRVGVMMLCRITAVPGEMQRRDCTLRTCLWADCLTVFLRPRSVPTRGRVDRGNRVRKGKIRRIPSRQNRGGKGGSETRYCTTGKSRRKYGRADARRSVNSPQAHKTKC